MTGLFDYLDTSAKQLGRIPGEVGGLLEDWWEWRQQNAGLLGEAGKAGIAATQKALKGDSLSDAEREALVNSPAASFGTADLQAPGLLIAGTYAGVKSATANKAALKAAKALEKKGGNAAPDGDIRQETGWFKEPSGEWQYEISDQNARLQPHPTDENRYLLNHPDLFAAYPQLEDMTIHRLRPDIDMRGWYDGKEMGVRGSGPETERRSTALHEVSHAVQDIEGFPLGSMPEWHNQQSIELTEPLFAEARARMASGEWTLEQAHDWLGEVTKGLMPSDLYRNVLGEFAARDVQARMDYPDWKRQAVPPYSSEKPANGIWTVRKLPPKGERGPASGADIALSTDQPDIPFGASAGAPPEQLVFTGPKAMFEAIEQFKAWGGKGNARVQDNKDGTWTAIREAASSGPQPTSGTLPAAPRPPSNWGVSGSGVANPGGGVAQPAAPPAFSRDAVRVADATNLPQNALIDPEGRLLTAPHIAGVRQPGGADVPMTQAEVRQLADRLFQGGVHDDPDFLKNNRAYGQAAVQMPGMAPTAADPEGLMPFMRLHMDTSKGGAGTAKYDDTFPHEVGHGIDFMSERTGRTEKMPITEIQNIPPAIIPELHAASKEARPDLWASHQPGYDPYRKRPTELMADAYRYYMVKPAEFKAKYPEAAKWMRSVVNEDPLLSQHVQFNVMAPGGGLLAPLYDDERQQ